MRIDYDWRNVAIDGADVEVALRAGDFRGVIVNMDNFTYQRLSKFLSASLFKYASSTSPYHFKYKYIDRGFMESVPSRPMLLGSSVHALYLTPDQFDLEFLIMDNVDLRTKEGKEKKLAALAAVGDRVLITRDIYDEAMTVVERMHKDPSMKRLSEGLKPEIAFFWKCPYSGLLMKSKVDGLAGDRLLELKTTMNCSPSQFERHAYNMNYDLSLAHYMQGIRILLGDDYVREQYFFCAETEEPYVVQAYKVSDEFLESGHSKWMGAVSQLESCFASNVWPGYCPFDEVPVLGIPRWANKVGFNEIG